MQSRERSWSHDASSVPFAEVLVRDHRGVRAEEDERARPRRRSTRNVRRRSFSSGRRPTGRRRSCSRRSSSSAGRARASRWARSPTDLRGGRARAALGGAYPGAEGGGHEDSSGEDRSRAAVLGVASSAKGATRPALALEQVRMLAAASCARPARPSPTDPRDRRRARLALASGFALRAAARGARKEDCPPVRERGCRSGAGPGRSRRRSGCSSTRRPETPSTRGWPRGGFGRGDARPSVRKGS